jgi:aspartyl-tRNA(Asn)/glutamyl-tRNA(Gln) amidotransferase subunit C
MSLAPDAIKKIAHLARLKINETDLPLYVEKLSNVFDLIAQMDSADTENIAPMAHPLKMTQRLRVDEVTETDQRELLQNNAPAVDAGLYLVPQVIE